MLRIFRNTLIASALAASPAFAADSDKSEEESFSLTSATCGDIYDLFSDATPGEDKDLGAVAEAQDDVLNFVLWVHGYLSGRDGIDHNERPLSKEGIEKTVADIDAVCEPDESKKFLDVVGNIK